MVDYYRAELVALPACAGTTRAAARMPALYSEDPGWLPVIVFIKDDSLPIGDVDLEGLIGSINKTLARAASGIDNAYWFHMDSHDGWFSDTMLGVIEKEIFNSLPVAGYYHDTEGANNINFIDALAQIPHTMQTVSMHIYDPVNLLPVFQEDCRFSTTLSGTTGVWWKSTFSAANPEAAAEVAINVLGASRIPCPYPLVAGPHCTAAAWVELPGSGLQLHFVKAQQFQAFPGEMQAFTRQVRSLRNLTAGSLDRFMYNSLMLKVNSLEPFVERAQALGLPFLVVNAGPEEQALFLDVPENDITIQLRSKKVGVASQMLPVWCEQSLGNLM